MMKKAIKDFTSEDWKEYNHKRYERDKENRLQYQHEYYLKNKEKINTSYSSLLMEIQTHVTIKSK